LDHNVYVTRLPYADSPPLMGAAVILGALSKWDRVLSLAHRKTKRFGVVTFGTMVPTPANRVRLNPSKRDVFGMPVLDIHIHFDREVQTTIDNSHRRLLSILSDAGYRADVVKRNDPLRPGWAAHFGGTARMHASPRYGVVNAWNRMHDVENVAVVDASSFTTGVEKNPTLTVMALAARAAHRLADDLKRDTVLSIRSRSDAVPTLR
jgi:choline dehydrogenase-like flavoprotein